MGTARILGHGGRSGQLLVGTHDPVTMRSERDGYASGDGGSQPAPASQDGRIRHLGGASASSPSVVYVSMQR